MQIINHNSQTKNHRVSNLLPKLKLAFMVLSSSVLFYSCQKDNMPITKPIIANNQSVETRAGIGCQNLIKNGDFALHPYVSSDAPSLCNDNIVNGAVSDWSTAFGSPNLTFVACCQAFNGVPGDETEFVNMQGSSDGIYQQLALSTDPDITYNMCFDAASPGALSIVLSKTAPPSGLNANPNKVIFNENLGTAQGGCDELFPFSFTFNTENKIYNYITFFPTKPSTDVVNIDNISLTCTNKKVKGIGFTKFNCDFDFYAVLKQPITVVSYMWDFGDGSTSTNPNPKHTYTKAGGYLVTLKVTDGNGCCTTVLQTVECGLEDKCNSSICWISYQGNFKYAQWATFQLPNGNIVTRQLVSLPSGSMYCPQTYTSVTYGAVVYNDPATYPINVPILVPGGYCETYASLIATVDQVMADYNIAGSYTNSFYRQNDCFKTNQANQDFYWTVNQGVGPHAIEWFNLAFPAGFWQGDPVNPLPGYYFHFNVPFKILSISGLPYYGSALPNQYRSDFVPEGCPN